MLVALFYAVDERWVLARGMIHGELIVDAAENSRRDADTRW